MSKGLNKMRELLVILIASVAFGLYVICPRMSAMLVQQAKVKGLNINAVIVLGALIWCFPLKVHSFIEGVGYERQGYCGITTACNLLSFRSNFTPAYSLF